MKRIYMVTYTYRKPDEVSNRELVKKFLDVGAAPGLISQYERLDGTGGVFFVDGTEDFTEKRYELTLQYGEYLTFDVTPVIEFDEALPVILKVFG